MHASVHHVKFLHPKGTQAADSNSHQVTHRSAIKSERVVLPDGTRPATVIVENGTIKTIAPHDYQGPCQDYGSLAILPGVIDPHVHFNEPGRTHWEGWETGTKAALAGGVTTAVDMPLNCIPSTNNLASLRLKQRSAGGKIFCDVGLWGGAVPGNAEDIPELVGAGALGLKCFLSDPGTAEFENLSAPHLQKAMEAIAQVNSVLLIHAEWPSALRGVDPTHDPETYEAWLSTRPVEAESEAVRQVVELSAQTGCRCHIVHISSPKVLKALEGTDLSCETCTHYLVFAAEEIGRQATNYKCAPPIRSREHQDGLWSALGDGRIQMITSDHSPCPPELKNSSFLESWGGIAGVQMLLTGVWTGASQRGYQLHDLARWLSEAPARLIGRAHELGSLAPGLTANMVVFDPEKESVCQTLYHRYQGSPYQGKAWKGEVVATYLRGECVYNNQSGHSAIPKGRLISNHP